LRSLSTLREKLIKIGARIVLQIELP